MERTPCTRVRCALIGTGSFRSEPSRRRRAAARLNLRPHLSVAVRSQHNRAPLSADGAVPDQAVAGRANLGHGPGMAIIEVFGCFAGHSGDSVAGRRLHDKTGFSSVACGIRSGRRCYVPTRVGRDFDRRGIESPRRVWHQRVGDACGIVQAGRCCVAGSRRTRDVDSARNRITEARFGISVLATSERRHCTRVQTPTPYVRVDTSFNLGRTCRRGPGSIS